MNRLYLTRPFGKGWSLQLLSKDQALLENFTIHCRVNLPKDVHWFLQCSSNTYVMFEFWTDKEDIILAACIEVSEFFKMDLQLDEPSSNWMNKFLIDG